MKEGKNIFNLNSEWQEHGDARLEPSSRVFKVEGIVCSPSTPPQYGSYNGEDTGCFRCQPGVRAL